MTLDQKQAIALFRYSVIAPLETGSFDPGKSKNDFFRDAAGKTYIDPEGKPRKISFHTIKKWHRYYKRDGFEGLMPQSRSDEGVSRSLDQDRKEQIRYLLDKHPRITAAETYRQLLSSGSIDIGEVSLSTIERFIRLVRKEDPVPQGKEMHRYERAHINEVWYGDTCFGPYLSTHEGKKRVYFMALIDDASRFIVAADVFFNDNYENLMSLIRSAVLKHGVPHLFSFDNGSSYRNQQMELLAARIGSSVHYCEPFTPTSKSKIERWFLTMRMQYLATLDMNQFDSIDALRRNFDAYVLRYNQTVHSSLNGLSPQERFFSEPEKIRRLSEFDATHSFMMEIERRVSADGVVSIDSKEYEVHYRYAKQRIRIRYSPDFSKTYVVEPSGELTSIDMRPLNKKDNSLIKREKVRLSDTEGGIS